ncbi:MAG: sigma-54 dependent transcriptional regulator [Thermodesulfobacteriota bacterium]|jgi:DNA-binding NtrC family response regulator
MAASAGRRILVVDDDPGVVDYLVEMLSEAGYVSEGVGSPHEALGRIEKEEFDLVIADIVMPGMRGLDLMAAIHARKPCQLVLFITAFGSIDLAVQAVRAGACDLITKPFQIEVLFVAIERAFRERQMRREIVRLRGTLSDVEPFDLVARSRAMRRVVDIARRIALTDVTVLLTGESGVGKGEIARFIHAHSPRNKGPFVQVNCAALPAPLVESELFGVRKGAYTDAWEDRSGLFIQASGGTLFLDEIAEMPLESQPKLLQVLETGTVHPIGGNGERKIDVRVIAATNAPLETRLRHGHFRVDLYYRLGVISLEIPPLRDRPEDIDALADVFLHRASTKFRRPIVGMTAEARRWILSHDWPGNVRELANMIERAVALSDHDTIQLEDLSLTSPALDNGDPLSNALHHAAAQGLSLADLERAYVRHVLAVTQGNKARAARILGIDRKTLYAKLGESEAADAKPLSP